MLPAPASDAGNPGIAMVHYGRRDLISGQCLVEFWPSALLTNLLPCTVAVRLPDQRDSTAGRVFLEPGQSTQVPLARLGGEMMRLSTVSAASEDDTADGVLFCSPALHLGGFAAESCVLVGGIHGFEVDAHPEGACLLQPGDALEVALSTATPTANFLVASSYLAEDLPVLQLKLIPRGVVHNCLPLPVSVVVSLPLLREQ